MKKMKIFCKQIVARFLIMAVVSLLLCSCAASTGYRAQIAENHALSGEMSLHITGKWHNVAKEESDRRTLWETLTREESSPNAVVVLKMQNEQTLVATLLTDGVETDSRTIAFKRRAPWLEIKQYVVHPLLWYLIWGLEIIDTAIGISASGDLCVNSFGQGSLMILVLPTIGGGGAHRGVVWYERIE